MNAANWAWRPDVRARRAIARGERRYAEWRRELAEQIAEQRREYLARRMAS